LTSGWLYPNCGYARQTKVIALLNEALQKELTAITQYFLHAEMCENWHYDKLGGYIRSCPLLK